MCLYKGLSQKNPFIVQYGECFSYAFVHFFINTIAMFLSIYYLLIGALAGFLAGLLGVGGGIIIVPSLLFVFTKIGLTQYFSFHLAIGTSLATIMFTSLFNLRTYQIHGCIRWDICKRIGGGVFLGAFIGAQLVGYVSAEPLKWAFIIFLLIVAGKMLMGSSTELTEQLPSTPWMWLIGSVIGFVASFIGISGAALLVPFMGRRIDLREAIGTSVALGFPVAFAGVLGNIVSGFGQSGLPTWSIGFVYLPALSFIVIASVPMAYIGAKIAHQLPVSILKKIFAMMLICVAFYMAYSL